MSDNGHIPQPRRLRRRGPPCAACLAVAVACGVVACGVRAFAQDAPRPAPPTATDDSSAAAATAATARGSVPLGQAPSVPDPLGRPQGWPAAGGPDKRGKGKGQNHVLSSIRAVPGSPLEPIDPPESALLPADGGPRQTDVIRAGFEEPLPRGAAVSAASSDGVQVLDNAKVVARVGPEVVLQGDILTPTAMDWLEKVSPGLTPEQVAELKSQICRQVIKPHVESLIVYVDACRTIPPDRLPEIEKKVNEAFDQQQLPRLVKDAGVASAAEYDQLLRSRGLSLDRIRKTFFERALAQQWLQQKVIDDDEIPHAEMIAWYQNHLAEYEFPAKVRFEQLTVKVTPERPRAQAWNQLAAMGNEVLQGKPFAEVAKARSEGPTAAAGGGYDWTTKGSLVSKVVDEVVFTLPAGQLSTILEDGGTLHIVRVIERTDAGRTPFIEAQVGIRDKLREDRRKRDMDEYLSHVRERTPVWTIFDDQPGGSPLQPGPQTAGQPRTRR
jgi:parvulin-like peptidyl-prolyl isomerase